ncbi:hypothetical protein DRN43_02955 [Thermococci archaeon]|uniref:hypothetical protein n=1 Tax=Palaeococcus sp. (in: euryarchaeotes) TaxID=2820298 RepID=UPI000F24C500|nr:hypothetical protein [Palaeococcus sp. (in: euryarchaeotes)]MCD6559026.1 hypothetical protein [Palaeococcus sp. (in: euryarchaeotes)]RLF76635.1 MAG: hypothetical protein DRN39_05520 [Thermococci archaeon]RLF89839.1 MAG: hypothetical protein DRN43_02955 [Thermococci archaeon]
MLLRIKPEKGLGKIEVKIPEDIEEEMRKIGERYGVSMERIIEMIISGEFKEPESFEDVEEEIKDLKSKAAELERRWAPLRYRAYGLSEDNKILAIKLSGMLAENIQLKRFLRKKIKQDWELRKKIEYYLR